MALQPLEQLNHDLPEREFFEGNQQVAMKLDESTSLFFSSLVRN
jgi:hypothetical protein